ncbi:MAG: hypothetical protein IT392_09585 [Nitrospirae bacterium]|nr:hypothetical protein [Nitrospirota bacterium]
MTVFVGYGRFTVDDQGTCTSGCDEESLCSSFSWQNFRNGNFNESRAHEANGMAYFVYPAINNSLTYFGKSKVKNVSGSKIYFKAFSPLPLEKQVRGIRSQNFLGVVWGTGTYRYLNMQQEMRFEQLLKEAYHLNSFSSE